MQKIFRIIVGLCLLATLGLSSCLKGPEYAIEPRITNVTIDKTVIDNFVESFVVSIDFEDGDADLGAIPDAQGDSGQSFDNVFLVDNRVNIGLDSLFLRAFSVETLTPSGGTQAIDGTIRVTISEICCFNESGSAACFPADVRIDTNEVVFDVYLVDRAGNTSNVMQTPPLTIRCR
ncbi:MAG: hypothetical protein R3E32_21415 [Chitinophagales bacterium]